MTTLQLSPSGQESDSRPSPQVRDRAGLVVLLAATAVFYLLNVTINGMANTFYAAAGWAGSRNWEALLFGSLDPANFITVDKPPVSQWVMGLSGSIFGFSSASMLVPQALMAVAAVALLYGAVARVCGPSVGLLAGALLALTPVAALMFRYNNPDAVMVLLMTAGAYCVVRALEHAAIKWMVWAGVALGFAFLAKMGEGLLVMPALALAHLIAAPTALRLRVWHLLAGLAACVVAAGWFVLLTVLWPVSSRPYIAGSTDNSFLDLALGKNGLSQLLGHKQAPAPGALDGGASQLPAQSAHGLARLFSGEIAVEVGWLVPAALLATAFVFVARRGAPRTDIVRAAVIVFGGWIVVAGLVLSYMPGNIHPYYCLSIAPAVAGAIALGVGEMWALRTSPAGRASLGLVVLSTGVWSWWVLGWHATWIPLLRWTILGLAATAAVALLCAATARSRMVLACAAAAGLISAVAGPAAYSIATVGHPHGGGRPAVGPASAARRSGGGDANLQPGPDNPQLDAMLSATHTRWSAATD